MNEFLSVKETASALHIHEVTVRRLIANNKIKAKKIGGKLYIDKKTIAVAEDKPIFDESLSYGNTLHQGRGLIGVWGVGYIGFSTLVYFAAEGIRGIGYDIDTKRVEKANRGEADIPGLDEWLNVPVKHFIAHKLFSVTNNYSKLLDSHPLVHFICIPTEKNGEPWFDPLKDVIVKIASHLQTHKLPFKPLIIIESTLTPGTSDKIVLKIFREHKLIEGTDFHFAIASRRDWFVDQDMTLKKLDRVYGAASEEGARQTQSVLALVCDKLHQAADYRIAELVKSIENAFRHMSITLANQLTLAYPSTSIREVLRLVGTKWNIDTYHPSFGTGGYCIPLSSKYVLSGAPYPHELSLLKQTISTDEKMPKLVARAIINKGIQSVGILGLSYRGNMKVPNLSPTISIAAELKKHGVEVRIHDPYFDDKEIKKITGCPTFIFPDDLNMFDAILIVSDHKEYQSPSVRRVFDRNKKCKVIYDNVGIWKNLTYFNDRGIEYHIPGDDNWLGTV